MSQKYIKTKNNNRNSAAFGKYFAQAVYDSKFIETDELASYIQQQASVKKSDIGAVLDELGEAMKHYFELGQKVRIKGLGIFKVGFSSIGVDKADDCTATTITDRRVLFQPESTRVVVGQKVKDGKVKQKYVVAKYLIKDVVFEETHDNAMNIEPENGNTEDNGEHQSSLENTENTGGSGSNTNPTNPSNGDNTGGGNTGGGNTGGDNTGGDNTGGDSNQGDDGSDQ